MLLHKKIEERKKHDSPINYSTLAVTEGGELTELKQGLKERVVKGYAVLWSSVNDRRERFTKGAFGKSIKEIGPESGAAYQIKFRDRHGKSCGLFQILKEDKIGLYFETKPLDKVSWADDLLVQLESGTINNFSIGFLHCWDKVEWDDENDIMVNNEARLFEISAVDIPSDVETYAVRANEEIEYLQDDIEEFIVSLPKSKHLEARKILTRCMSLKNEEPLEQRMKALRKKKPTKVDVDFGFLIDKLKNY